MHHLVWVDIPVVEMERAIRFYQQVLNILIDREFPDMPIAVFRHQRSAVSACLFRKESELPGDRGPLIYFNADGRLDDALEQVRLCGGKVLKNKHSIGPFGYRAIVLDSEGNRIALHSMPLRKPQD